MRKLTHITVAIGALAGAVVGWTPTAGAAPGNVNSAQDTITRLQMLGYNVNLNGSITAPLADCRVLAVHPSDPGTTPATTFTNLWLDISCPPTNN